MRDAMVRASVNAAVLTGAGLLTGARLSAGVGLLAAGLLASPAAAQFEAASKDCTHPRFQFCAGCDTIVPVRAKPGGFCRFTYGAGGGVFSQKVVVRPKQGIYGVSNETLGGLKVADTARGQDSFQVDLEYEVNGRRVVTHLKFDVTIDGR